MHASATTSAVRRVNARGIVARFASRALILPERTPLASES